MWIEKSRYHIYLHRRKKKFILELESPEEERGLCYNWKVDGKQNRQEGQGNEGGVDCVDFVAAAAGDGVGETVVVAAAAC